MGKWLSIFRNWWLYSAEYAASCGFTHPHRRGFPCCLLFPLAHMPSPLPRWVLRVFRSVFPENIGLPHFSGGSAPTLPVSRPAQRSLTLRPACSLTPRGGFLLKCFSPVRYLLEPLQVLPAGATVAGRDSHPLETTRLSRRTEKSGLGLLNISCTLRINLP